MAVEIIAEIAQGYEGDITLARMLARAAIRAGADAIKFQLVYADDTATPDYKYYDFFRKLEMPFEIWQRVAGKIKASGKRFYLDVGGERALNEAIKLRADGVKIHATNFYNTDLVRAALKAMPRVFISLGGISIEELGEFLKYHSITPNQQVCFMYGFQAEPTPLEANNLLRIISIKKRFPGFPIGFMDHTDGSSGDAQTLSLLVLPLGIQFLEKHISLDRTLQLEDFISALDPSSFQEFVNRIRRHELALGMENLEMTEVEKEYRKKALKVVVAKKSLKKGEKIIPEDLALKRVSVVSETPIYRKEDAVGHTLLIDIFQDQQITKEMFS